VTKERSFVDQIAANTGEDPEVVSRIIEEFCLGLRLTLDFAAPPLDQQQ